MFKCTIFSCKTLPYSLQWRTHKGDRYLGKPVHAIGSTLNVPHHSGFNLYAVHLLQTIPKKAALRLSNRMYMVSQVFTFPEADSVQKQ